MDGPSNPYFIVNDINRCIMGSLIINLSEFEKPYQNVCWNCRHTIDSRFSLKSNTPDMGYYCNQCGKDLTEWKLRKSIQQQNYLFGAPTEEPIGIKSEPTNQ